MSTVTSIAFRTFTKKHGISLKADALKLLVSTLKDFPKDELAQTIDYIALSLLKLQSKSKIVDAAQLQQVIALIFKKSDVLSNSNSNKAHDPTVSDKSINLRKSGETSELCRNAVNYIEVINAFSVPAFSWQASTKSFVSSNMPKRLLCSGEAKATALRERYHVLLQRILRNEAFQKKSFSIHHSSPNHYEITPIKQLYGQLPGSEFLLFGYLTEIEEGKLHLEDPDELVELILEKDVPRGIGLFTLGSFVLVDGTYTSDKRFRVSCISLPIFENRDTTLNAYGHSVNFFGNKDDIISKDDILSLEKSLPNTSIAVISELHLDDPETLAGVRKMIQSFVEPGIVPPSAFIFCGNFASKPGSYDAVTQSASDGNTVSDIDSYTKGFDLLADVLGEFAMFSKRNPDAPALVFIPGPFDPWTGGVLPSPGLPKDIGERLRRKVGNVTFTSNPCRLEFFTQEFVFFRADAINKMLRNVLLAPLDKIDIPTKFGASDHSRFAGGAGDSVPIEVHFATTILDQAHLSPVFQDVQPVYWSHDSSLMLYPPPHNVIIADQCNSYVHSYNGSTICNPSSFKTKKGFSFLLYNISTRKWEKR